MSNETSSEIDSADITERLVGITPVYLNNFLQRELFGLKASVQTGKVRAKRRLFSRDDVFGIALVWMLFESGLRTEPIIRVLKGITESAKPNANAAAKKLLESGAEYLLIVREPRMPTKSPESKPNQQALCPVRRAELSNAFEQYPASDLLAIPVGNKFADLGKRLEILFPHLP